MGVVDARGAGPHGGGAGGPPRAALVAALAGAVLFAAGVVVATRPHRPPVAAPVAPPVREPTWERASVPGTPPVVVAGGAVVVLSRGGELAAVDPTDGRVRWHSTTVALRRPGGWLVAGHGVVVAARATRVEVSDAATGVRRWEVALPARVAAPPSVDGDGGVWIPQEDGRLLHLDGSGATVGAVPIGTVTRTSAVLITPQVVVVCGDGIVGLDPQDGRVRWRALFAGRLRCREVGGQVLVASDQGTVAVFDAEGRPRWTVEVGPLVGGPQVVGGTVVVRGRGGAVTAFDLASGGRLWQVRPVPPPLLLGRDLDTVVVRSGDREVYALATIDGTAAWWWRAPGPLASDPLAVAGVVLASLADGRVVAVQR